MMRLKRILVNNTTERQLSWLVGIAVGRDWSCGGMYNPIYNFNDEYIHDGGDYANNWNLSGPIIEREIDNIYRDCEGTWVAIKVCSDGRINSHQSADTPLIAAMRCFVTSKLGDEVEIPEELI